MNIKIAENLKKLRREKAVTQEDLAQALDISVQAVSKWEREESMPDIALLPKIAMYYKTTVDDLLGVGEVQIAQRIQEYRDRSMPLQRDGKRDKDLVLWREAAKEIPNNIEVLFSLMYALMAASNHYPELLGETIEIAQRAFDEGEGDKRSSAIQVLTIAYSNIGNYDKAKQYAVLAPNSDLSSNELLKFALQGDEAVSHIQRNIMVYIDSISIDCYLLLSKGSYSNDEKRQIHNFCLNLYKLLYNKGDFGFFFVRTQSLYLSLAYCGAKDGDVEYTIENLSLCADHAIKYVTLTDGKYESLLVNMQEHKKDCTSTSHNENTCTLTLEYLNNSLFDFCRDDARFKEIENRLTQHAGTW